MFKFFKRFVRAGVIGAVLVGTAAGAAVMIAGPHRARAVVSQVHGHVIEQIDDHIDDPAALRTQLQEMEREYPKRIAQVRGDLAELREEMRQLEREGEIARRVVALAEADEAELEAKLAQASSQVESGSARLVAVTVDDRMYSYERAATRLNQVRSTRVAYYNRAEDANHDLKFLAQQESRLQDLVTQLEAERAQFRTQIDALTRQVDAIARNERLITLLEKRNDTIERCSRYEAVSLDQITGRLAEIRSRQEAELDLLASEQEEEDYEDMARMQLSIEGKSFEQRALQMESAATDYTTALNGSGK